jgi:hypothetical protein
MKDNLIKIGPVLLTIAELLIAWAMHKLRADTMTVARASGVCKAITDADPRPPRTADVLATSFKPSTIPTYEQCAEGYKACQMLILAGVAEWDNKTQSAIRLTPAGREAAEEISDAYVKWAHDTLSAAGPETPDIAACVVAGTATTREPSAGAAEGQAAFTVGTLVTYKPSANRANRTEANGWTQTRRMGIVMDVSGLGDTAQVNWGTYGTFWDRTANLEVLNASR